MRKLLVVALLAACTATLASAARAQEDRPSGVLVFGLPVDELRILAARQRIAVGLGVYPPSREATGFLDALVYGDGPDGGILGAATAAGLEVRAGLAARAAGTPAAAVAAAFGQPSTIARALDAPISVLAVRLADDVEAVLRLDRRPAFVIASDGRTPMLVASLDVPATGLLANGIARRDGLVTPADLARSILAAAGIDAGEPGLVLTVEPHAAPLTDLEELRHRLEDDLGILLPLTLAAVAAGIGAVVIGSAALAWRRGRLAAAFAVGAAAIPAGYTAGLVLPGASWEARAAIVAGAVALGMGVSLAGARRAAGWLLVLTAFAVAALTGIAAAAPEGRIALGLWGNPLESWRFFGLLNHQAAFVTGGFLIGGTLLALPASLLAVGAVVVGVVVGAPALGANFVAVLTLGFAAVLIVLARAAGRPRFLHLPFAAVGGVLAMGAALLADAGSPVTHGGRAVRDIRSGGVDAAWDILTRRARLNYEEIAELGVVGVVAFVLSVFALAMLFWWALRAEAPDPIARAGVAGVAGTALLTLVVEDTGFFTGAIIGLFAWIAWAIETTRTLEHPAEAVAAAHPPPAARAEPVEPPPA